MKKYIVYIKAILLVVLASAVYGFTTHRNAGRAIAKDVAISFDGENHLYITHQMVNNLLIQNKKRVVNQPKTLINLHELELKVQSHPMVSSAQVSVGIEGDLSVKVKQRKPLARMCTAEQVLYIDTKGLLMPLSKSYSARVPLVDNKNNSIEPKVIFPLLQKIYSDDFLKSLVISLHKNKEGYWFQTRHHQQKVMLGDLKKIDQKLKKLKMFYTYMEKDSLSNTFKKINVQYNNQIVCSK